MGVNYLVPLLSIPILSSRLSIDDLGSVLVFQALVLIFCQVVDFGFSITGTRAAANVINRKDLSNLINEVIFSKLFIALVAVLLLFFLFALNVFDFKDPHRIFYLIIAVIGNVFFLGWFFQGVSDFLSLAIINISSKFLYLAGIFLFVRTSSDTDYAMLLFSLMYFLMGGGSLLLVLRSNNVEFRKVSIQKIKINLFNTFRPFASIFLLSFHTQIFVALISMSFGDDVAASTATADKIVRGIAVAMSPLTITMFPILSRRFNNGDYAEYQMMWKRITILIVILSITSSISLFFFSDFISQLFFKSNYLELSCYIKKLSLQPFFIGLGVMLGGLGLIIIGDDGWYLLSICTAEILALIIFAIFWKIGNRDAGIYGLIIADVSMCFMFAIGYIKRGFYGK